MDAGKLFERSVSSFWAEIQPYFTLRQIVAETRLGASWFWPSSAPVPGTWGFFSSSGDSKITPDGIGLQWNGESKTFWMLTFELLSQNIAQPYFKTERVAETAISASWFWPTMARSSKTWVMVSSPGDSKITRDGLGFGLDARKWAFKKFSCVHFTAKKGHQELV